MYGWVYICFWWECPFILNLFDDCMSDFETMYKIKRKSFPFNYPILRWSWKLKGYAFFFIISAIIIHKCVSKLKRFWWGIPIHLRQCKKCRVEKRRRPLRNSQLPCMQATQLCMDLTPRAGIRGKSRTRFRFKARGKSGKSGGSLR